MKKEEKKVPQLRFPKFAGDWEQCKSGEIAPLRGGFAFKSNEYCSEGIPIVRISNILSDGSVGEDYAYYCEQASDEIYTLYDGAVVLAMSGATTGKVSVLCAEKGQKYYQNQRVGYFIPTDICDYSFVKTIMRSHLFTDQLSAVLVAGAQPNVSSKEIDGFEFLIPQSKEEQKKIGAYFTNLDHLITLHQRKLEKIKEFKKGVMQKLFSQEVRFKADDESEFPEWEEKTFHEVIKLYRGSSPRPIVEYIVDDNQGLNWIKISDVPQNGNVITTVKEHISKEGAEKSRAVYKGEIILSNSMSFGKPCILGIDGFIHDGWFVIREYEKYLNKWYLCQLLNSDIMYKQYRRLAAGGVVLNISSEIVNSTKIPVPCLAEQQKIADCLSSLDEVIEKQKATLAAWKELKKGLLQQMFV